ncbi:hypothetical protein [Streptomyces sp. NPDC051364]|uniref:hypothetical protein n=1 Tax=Streptomyces sp. NPDC051364 TaxID=3155799 RepID=UPI0034145D6B
MGHTRGRTARRPRRRDGRGELTEYIETRRGYDYSHRDSHHARGARRDAREATIDAYGQHLIPALGT